MKLLMLDTDGEGMGLDLCLRAREFDHEVRYWLPSEDAASYGDGMIDKPKEWQSSMDWADLIVTSGNSTLGEELAPYFGKGYPILGANERSAELELDRGIGQDVLERHGVATLPFQVVSSAAEAVEVLVSEDKPFVMKPWGGDADKAMTCVPSTVDEAIFTVQKWDREGKFKGQLMLQEKVDGIEMGIAGWFGPGGWLAALEESFEHKKFLNDDLGENTGEMGTVLRHVEKSKLFEAVLEPVSDYLHECNYVGDCSVNCIIDSKGRPWPLEFTMRLGWPDFCIRQAVIQGDPIEWMLDLVRGYDSLEVSTDIALGLVMAHGDFPKCKDPPAKWSGYPIAGIDAERLSQLHFQQVKQGKYPIALGGKVRQVAGPVTAGTYVMVVSGAGKTVTKASEKAYGAAWEVKWPGNRMFRTDIGKRLEKELDVLQGFGFAEGMKYG